MSPHTLICCVASPTDRQKIENSLLQNFCQQFPGHWNTGALETRWTFTPSRPIGHSKVLSPETAPLLCWPPGTHIGMTQLLWNNSRTIAPELMNFQ